MARAHLKRVIQSRSGDVVLGSSVRVLQDDTTTLIPDTLYTTEAGSTTLANPFISGDGQIDFYIANPKRVRLGITPPGGVEFFIDAVDIFPEADNVVIANAPLSLGTPVSNSYMHVNSSGQVEYVALPANLTAFAAIDPTAGSGVLATDGAGWLRKTYAALKTAMAVVGVTSATVPPSTNTTGGVIGTDPDAAHADHTHQIGDHDHSATGKGAKLAQANTHQTPDTDTATTALHHTLGTGANQAAAGNHTHTKTYRISKTIAISGTVGAISTPYDFIPAPTGQTSKLVSVETLLGAGTCTVAIQKSGTTLSGLGAISVTTTAANTVATGTGSDNVFADLQAWRAVVSSPSSATDLTVTAIFDLTV